MLSAMLLSASLVSTPCDIDLEFNGVLPGWNAMGSYVAAYRDGYRGPDEFGGKIKFIEGWYSITYTILGRNIINYHKLVSMMQTQPELENDVGTVHCLIDKVGSLTCTVVRKKSNTRVVVDVDPASGKILGSFEQLLGDNKGPACFLK